MVSLGTPFYLLIRRGRMFPQCIDAALGGYLSAFTMWGKSSVCSRGLAICVRCGCVDGSIMSELILLQVD